MADVLIDTDIFIDHIRGSRLLPVRPGETWYSVITRAELFAGRTKETEVRRLLTAAREIPVESSIAERAGRLVRDAGLDLADALIAATALEHRLTLVTRNRRDFERVRGLKLRSPD
jgi:predicted nucleic acid-binding protein